MYLNIGQDKLILKENIVGIFDFDNTTTSKHTQKFLQNAEKQKITSYFTYDLPKSFVIYRNNEENQIFVSEFSSKTLQKRMET